VGALNVDDDVVGDGVEPRPKRMRPEPGQRRQRLHENLAGCVLGQLAGAEPPVAVGIDRIEIAVVKRLEGARVSLGALDQRLIAQVTRFALAGHDSPPLRRIDSRPPR
jgi:hypothetical protein